MSERCGAALTVPYAPPATPPPKKKKKTNPGVPANKKKKPTPEFLLTASGVSPLDPGADFDRLASTDRAADPAHSAHQASANRDFLPALQIPAGHRVRAESCSAVAVIGAAGRRPVAVPESGMLTEELGA